MIFSQGTHSEVNFYYYLFGSVIYFLAGYSFSFLCGNSMIALAILLLFPILVLPFIDRVIPIASSVIIYDLVFQLIHTNYSIMRFIVFIIWLVGLFFTSYCLIRKEFLSQIKIVLLDETTSNLDRLIEKEIQDFGTHILLLKNKHY